MRVVQPRSPPPSHRPATSANSLADARRVADHESWEALIGRAGTRHRRSWPAYRRSDSAGNRCRQTGRCLWRLRSSPPGPSRAPRGGMPTRRLSTTVPVSASQLPGGGDVLFPGRRLVAIYGHPGDSNLGVLGEQPVDAALQRAGEVAAGYDAVSEEPVVPTLEIITTVASSEAGADGDYSSESSLDHIRPWVDAAGAAGFYVVLDLQPGHADFLTQAMRYEELLAFPHVGLALDPEWRIALVSSTWWTSARSPPTKSIASRRGWPS